MGWKSALLSSLFLITLAEFSNRSGNMWRINQGAGSSLLSSWTMDSASIFVLVALVLSMYLIFEHLAAYNQPEEQKFLIGLILMVPVYAVELFLSLLDSNAAFHSEIIRDCYEAFALYCFERYLIACLGLGFAKFPNCSDVIRACLIFGTSAWAPFGSYLCGSLVKLDLVHMLGGERSTIEFMESHSLVTSSVPLLDEAYAYGVVEHPFPLNCFLMDWRLGSDFYQAVKIGIVQYMISKMLCALLAMICDVFGVYGEGKFEWRYIVLNFSQTWALYCLVQFYSVTKHKLAPIKPLAKFLVFKSIVFLTWWQGVAVAFLFSIGAFKGALAQQLKTRIQDYIICIEMGVAAVVHLYVFPAAPYKRGERCVRNVAVMADYASLGASPDPEEVRDCERSTRVGITRHDERKKRLKLHQSVRDVVVGSGEIIVDDMKFTVSHVVEPVERGIAKINRTFHQISENVKRHEERKRSSKDDSYLVPLNSWTREFSDVRDNLVEGTVSDSGLPDGKHTRSQSKGISSQFIHR